MKKHYRPARHVWPRKLKTFREKHDISRKELGEALGVNHSTVWSWENGRYIPNAESQEWLKELEEAFEKYG